MGGARQADVIVPPVLVAIHREGRKYYRYV